MRDRIEEVAQEEETLGAVVADEWPPPSTPDEEEQVEDEPDAWLLDDDSVYDNDVEAAVRKLRYKVLFWKISFSTTRPAGVILVVLLGGGFLGGSYLTFYWVVSSTS